MIDQREQGLCRITYARPDQPVCQLYPFPGTYIGIQHGLLSKDLQGVREWLPAVTVAVVTLVVRNLGIGFAAGAGLHFAIAGGEKLWGLVQIRKQEAGT